jgi:hypothetical protein
MVRAGFPLVGLLGLLLGLGPGCAGLDPKMVEELLAMGGASGKPGLDERTIISGLREALSVGTQRTVASTARRDGYWGDAQLRIPLPVAFDRTAAGLRSVGLGSLVDDFELTMNRAAERAAAEATPVFVRAITQITFADARSILGGDERAATRYFESRTRPELGQRFAPIIQASMQEVGLVRLYDGLVKRIAQLPLVPAPSLDLEAYVTDKALAGLFTVLAREEAKIRRDPAARTTELLRTVFGAR